MAIEIPSEILDIYHEGIDAVINTYGKWCKLFFLPTRTECPNCILDTFSGVSAGVYKTGGPISFSDGICPYCNNIGYIDTQNTTPVKMIVLWNPKDWTKVGKLVIPEGGIQTNGFMTDFPKIDQCIKMQITGLDGYKEFMFEKVGSPTPYGLAHRWVNVFWKRI